MAKVGRRLKDWGLDPVVTCLRDLAHEPDGVHDHRLRPEGSMYQALLDHPAVRHRSHAGVSSSGAVRQALEDARRAASPTLTPDEWHAVFVLLRLEARAEVDGALTDVDVADPKDRAEKAFAALHRHASAATLMQPTGTSPKHSPVTRLLEKAKEALDGLRPPDSVTRGLGPTPELLGPDPVVAVDDLEGTWLGTLVTPRALKTSAVDPPRRLPCHMVVTRRDGVLNLRWLMAEGASRLVALRVVQVEDVRRLVCVYEAEVTFGGANRPDPAHRGACIIEAGRHPATVVAGPYWSDRQTWGELRFDRRHDAIATSFAEADALG